MRSLSVVAGVGASLLVASASPAFASTAGLSGSSLVFTGSPGESNNAEVEGGTGGLRFRVEDLGALIVPGPGCSQDGPHHVLCPSAGITSVSFDAGDRNDLLIDNTAVPSTLKGGCGNDVVEGGSVNDLLIGDPSGCRQPGTDSLDGRDGADTIAGGPGGDTVNGGAGNDRVSGGPGQDQMNGGGGSDRIGALDGEVDTVTCGAGFDSVRADPTDSVAPDCERVVT